MGTNTYQTPIHVGVSVACGGSLTSPQADRFQGTALPAAVRLRVPMTGLPVGATTDEKSTTPGTPPSRTPPS